MTIELIFACDRQLHKYVAKYCYLFHTVSDGRSVLQVLAWFEHCLKLKPVNLGPPIYSLEGKKNQKFRRAPEGVRTEQITDFEMGSRVFCGRILIAKSVQ